MLPKPDQNNPSKRPNLSYWFWGTIAVLMLITLSLHLLSAWQASRRESEIGSGNGGQPDLVTKATEVERWLEKAGLKAEEVKGQIDPLLDQAYAPVYAAIPTYTDFHYSLAGDLSELGAVVFSNIGTGLEEKLFSGLEARLRDVETKLVKDFTEKFNATLLAETKVNPSGDPVLSQMVIKVTGDATDRLTNTLGTAVGGASLKGLTTVFAKKLGTKIAGKVAAKTGAKWASVAAGAGTGTAACAWAGPGAAACLVVGAGIVWVGFDLAAIKLDEYVSREEFERDIKDLIDAHKDQTRGALAAMLRDKKLALDRENSKTIQQISLSELQDADRSLACEDATLLLSRYEAIARSLKARSPAQVEQLRMALSKQAKNHLLAPWLNEMSDTLNLNRFAPEIKGDIVLDVIFSVAPPDDYEMSASLWRT